MRMVGYFEDVISLIACRINDDNFDGELSLAEDVSFPIADLSPQNSCFTSWYTLCRLEELENKLGTDNKLFAFGYNGNGLTQIINIYQDDNIDAIKKNIKEVITRCLSGMPLEQDLFYLTDEEI